MASTQTSAGAARPRPLSPHLQVYRWTITMAISMAHRITGVGLYGGVLLLAWFLIAASSDAASYAWFAWFIHSIIGRLVLFGFTWALYHHMLGGVRHFIMDAGYGLDEPLSDVLAWGVLVCGVGLTLITWIIGYIMR